VPAKFQPNRIQGKFSKLLEVFRRLPGPAETHEKRGAGYYLSAGLTNVGVGDASMVNSSTLCVIGVGRRNGALSEGAAGRRARFGTRFFWTARVFRQDVFDSALSTMRFRDRGTGQRPKPKDEKKQKTRKKKPKKKPKK
jgi:hypothetical protein